MKLQISKKEMSALFEKAKWTFELSKEEIVNLTNLLNVHVKRIFCMEFTMVLRLLVFALNRQVIILP